MTTSDPRTDARPELSAYHRQVIEARGCYVWVWLPGAVAPVVAGRLEMGSGPGAREPALSFAYGRSYRERTDAISLFAPELPCGRARSIRRARSPQAESPASSRAACATPAPTRGDAGSSTSASVPARTWTSPS